MTPVGVIRVEAGAGKTTAAIDKIIETVKSEGHVVVAVPDLNLADEMCETIADEFGKSGLSEDDVQVWRGISAPGQCQRPGDVRKVQKAGFSAKNTLCFKPAYREHWTPEKGHHLVRAGRDVACPLATRCAMAVQRAQYPAVWITTHAALMTYREAQFLGEDRVDLLVVDESPLRAAIPARAGGISVPLDELAIIPEDDVPETVVDYWAGLARVLKGFELPSYQVDSGMLALAESPSDALSWHKAIEKEYALPSGLEGAALERAIAASAPGAFHSRRVQILQEIKRIRAESSCRGLIVEKGVLNLWELRSFDPSWTAGSKILHLDASAPDDLSILEPIFGRTLEFLVDEKAIWPEAVTCIQIKGAPIQASRRGSDRNKARMNVFVRDVCHRHKGQVLAVLQKDLNLFEGKSPTNLETTSTGKARGSNAWQDCAAVIVAAQTDPGPEEIERQAAILGVLDDRLPVPAEGKRSWWKDGSKRILTRDGQDILLNRPRHPCAAVEALRGQVVGATLYQAIARSRFVRRKDHSPLTIYVCSDEPLDIEVDQVIGWDVAADAATWSEVARDTGIFTTATHMAMAVGEDVEAVKKRYDRAGFSGDSTGHFLINNNYKDLSRCVPQKRFEYRVTGDTHIHTFLYAPDAPFADNVTGYVESVLGCKIEIRVDPAAAMVDAGVFFTSPTHIMSAVPGAWPSLDAAKKALQRAPLHTPADWDEYTVLLEGKGQRESTIHVRPDISTDDAGKLIETKLKKKIKKLIHVNEIEIA